MITLSGFGYEKKLKNPSKVFANTWKEKSFINGPTVKKFEEEFAKFCNTNDCVTVGSCTGAAGTVPDNFFSLSDCVGSC